MATRPKILQNRCRITLIPRDSAWYDDLFSFSDTSMQLSNKNKREHRENNRTILTKHTSDLANLLVVKSSVVTDRTKSSF